MSYSTRIIDLHREYTLAKLTKDGEVSTGKIHEIFGLHRSQITRLFTGIIADIPEIERVHGGCKVNDSFSYSFANTKPFDAKLLVDYVELLFDGYKKGSEKWTAKMANDHVLYSCIEALLVENGHIQTKDLVDNLKISIQQSTKFIANYRQAGDLPENHTNVRYELDRRRHVKTVTFHPRHLKSEASSFNYITAIQELFRDIT